MTSIPPSAAAPAAPTAAATGSTAVLTQMPEAVRASAPGTVITGTVTGRDAQGQVLLQTNNGVIALRTAAQLAVGTQISLQIQAAGSQLHAILLSAAAPKPGSLAAAAPTGRPSATGPAAPATTVAVSSGPVLTATVLSSQSGGPVPANVAPAPLPPGPTSTGPAAPAPSPAASPAATAATRAAAGTPAGAPAAPQAPAPGVASAPALPSSPLVVQSFPAAPAAASAAATYAAAQGPVPAGPTPAATPPTLTASTPAPGPAATGGTGTPASPLPPTPAQGASSAPAAPATASANFQPAAAGTPVQLRLVASAPTPGAPIPPNQVAATLVGYAPGGHAVVDSPLGRLALPLPPGAAQPSPGTSLLFEVLALGARAAASASANPLPTLGREWPTLKAAMAALGDIDLPVARQILEINMPRLGSPRFLGQLLHHLGMPAAGDARALLGETAVALLERAGRNDILARLDAELREMLRLNRGDSEWQLFWVPILDASELRQLRIFTRRKKSNKGKDRDGGRFVVEAEFDELGPMQIDGLVKKPRIDVILRSHAELPPAMQAGIAEVFGRTCDASGLVGKIFFHAAATFPVSPLDEMAKTGPGLQV